MTTWLEGSYIRDPTTKRADGARSTPVGRRSSSGANNSICWRSGSRAFPCSRQIGRSEPSHGRKRW